MKRDGKTLAAQFAELHRTRPFTLVNIWDVWSARECEAAGHRAIATSSRAVAESLGFKDGQMIPLDTLLSIVERISRAVSIPLSVDFEAGFGDTPQQVEDNVGRVVDAGAIGINLEDGLSQGKRMLVGIDEHSEKIARSRAAAASRDIPLFINARFDGFLITKTETDELVDEAIERGRRYEAAGANGLFVPGLTKLPLIERLSRSLALPLNVMMMPAGPSVAELSAAGVSRISLGPWPFEYARSAFRKTVKAFEADSSSFFAAAK